MSNCLRAHRAIDPNSAAVNPKNLSFETGTVSAIAIIFRTKSGKIAYIRPSITNISAVAVKN